jgi:hypothetical protein
VFLIIINKYLSEKDLTSIFNLLKHPLRRGIIKILAEKPQTYSSILKNLNIAESSILNYHLREMDELLIKKDNNAKYALTEIGEICLQLILRVKEKEKIQSYYKLQKVVENLKTLVFLIQIIFLPVVITLSLELYLLNIINLGAILGMFSSGIIISILLSTSIFLINNKTKGIDKIRFELDKKDKVSIITTIFTIWILIEIIFCLLL